MKKNKKIGIITAVFLLALVIAGHFIPVASKSYSVSGDCFDVSRSYRAIFGGVEDYRHADEPGNRYFPVDPLMGPCPEGLKTITVTDKLYLW